MKGKIATYANGRPVYGPEKEKHRLIRVLVTALDEPSAIKNAGDILEIMRLGGTISHYHSFGSTVVCDYKGGEELDTTYGLNAIYRFSDPMGKLLVQQTFTATRDAHVNAWKTLLGSKTHYGPQPEGYEENIGEMLEQCRADFEILGNPASPANVLFGPAGLPVITEQHLEEATEEIPCQPDPLHPEVPLWFHPWVVGVLVGGFVTVKPTSWQIQKLAARTDPTGEFK